MLSAIAVIWAVASIGAMTYGTLVNWPDYVHTNFGIPFTFATHTTSTIAGAADDWAMDLGALTADLAFWLIGMIAIVFAGLVRNPEYRTSLPQGVS